ncbi:unnamed protein product [Arctia plantaginis]|uniref:Uncharacterized protein n=1 Tax=Arctia plantaginis TaxID=874455 RepID=A0A8S0Z9M9_ARCPL|nr:unnamed protein product [Arctia plantaginis]
MSYGSPKKNSSPPLRRSEPNLACSNDINDNISQRKRKRGDEADLQRMENMMLDMKSMFSELVSQQEQHNIKIDALHSALEGFNALEGTDILASAKVMSCSAGPNCLE